VHICVSLLADEGGFGGELFMDCFHVLADEGVFGGELFIDCFYVLADEGGFGGELFASMRLMLHEFIVLGRVSLDGGVNTLERLLLNRVVSQTLFLPLHVHQYNIIGSEQKGYKLYNSLFLIYLCR
jgi:hypothetical protein